MRAPVMISMDRPTAHLVRKSDELWSLVLHLASAIVVMTYLLDLPIYAQGVGFQHMKFGGLLVWRLGELHGLRASCSWIGCPHDRWCYRGRLWQHRAAA